MIAELQFIASPPPPADGEVTTITTAKGSSTMREHDVEQRPCALGLLTGWTGAPGTTSPEDGKPAVRGGSPL